MLRYVSCFFQKNKMLLCELAGLASKKQVLAVVADETNFLICGDKWKLWSARTLDVDQFLITEYNREALRQQLNLTAHQLKILATIAGNNMIPYEDVKGLHKRLNTQFHNHFYELAKYVRELPSTLDESLKYISNEIYGSEDEKFIKRLAESIQMYDSPCSELDTPQETVPQSLATHNRFFNAIVKGLPINLVLHYMDLRRTDFVPYFELLKPILSRAIGVFRCQVQSETNYLQIVKTKVKHDEPYKDFEVAPEYATHIGTQFLNYCKN